MTPFCLVFGGSMSIYILVKGDGSPRWTGLIGLALCGALIVAERMRA